MKKNYSFSLLETYIGNKIELSQVVFCRVNFGCNIIIIVNGGWAIIGTLDKLIKWLIQSSSVPRTCVSDYIALAANLVLIFACQLL